jgi:hypothetical protein
MVGAIEDVVRNALDVLGTLMQNVSRKMVVGAIVRYGAETLVGTLVGAGAIGTWNVKMLMERVN